MNARTANKATMVSLALLSAMLVWGAVPSPNAIAGGSAGPSAATRPPRTDGTAPTRKNGPPGTVIAHSPASSRVYLGSPGIVQLDEKTYLAKHDEYGPGSTAKTRAVTHLYRSDDAGATWKHLSTVRGLFWASLFLHRDAVYMMGADRMNGNVVICRSDDLGKTWTSPGDRSTGLLLEGHYHTAPVPVVEHRGRLWRAMEKADLEERWPLRFGAFMMSAPADADLLDRDSWTTSEILRRDAAWLDGRFAGWLEGNAVVSPDGEVLNLLRVHFGSRKNPLLDAWSEEDGWGYTAVIHYAEDGRSASFDPERDFTEFPGGLVKFTIRKDPRTGYYWALTNITPKSHRGAKRFADRVRNTVALIRSKDLTSWEIRSALLYHPDPMAVGFQYLDWRFEGDDIIAVSRTSWPDGTVSPDEEHRGVDRAHDANYFTFHRFTDFRDRTLEDSVTDALKPGIAPAGEGSPQR